MKVKLAVTPYPGAPTKFEYAELAEPGPGQVRVKIKTCAICHSDIHSMRSEHGAWPPYGSGGATSGHEVAGIVDKVGEGVTYVKEGDRVVCCLVSVGCGQCRQCMLGRPAFCEKYGGFHFNTPSQYTRYDGQPMVDLSGYFAGFAEYTNVAENHLVKLMDGVPFEVGSLIGCGFLSGFGAVLNCLKLQANESMAVIGCGGVGMSAIMGGRFSGAFPLIAIDTVDAKLELARELGATHTFNPLRDDVIAEVKKATYGYGTDTAVVALAGKKFKKQALDMNARFGRICTIGHGTREDECMDLFSAMDFMSGGVFTGSAMGNSQIRKDLPRFQELYLHGVVKLDSMLSNKYPLEKLDEAIEEMLCGKAVKNWIEFDD